MLFDEVQTFYHFSTRMVLGLQIITPGNKIQGLWVMFILAILQFGVRFLMGTTEVIDSSTFILKLS